MPKPKSLRYNFKIWNVLERIWNEFGTFWNEFGTNLERFGTVKCDIILSCEKYIQNQKGYYKIVFHFFFIFNSKKINSINFDIHNFLKYHCF